MLDKDAFWSAVVRQQVREVLAFILEDKGYTKEAEELRNVSRLTKSRIDALRKTVSAEKSPEDEIRNLIESGELKEAKKLLKANKETIDREVYKTLKKELKNG